MGLSIPFLYDVSNVELYPPHSNTLRVMHSTNYCVHACTFALLAFSSTVVHFTQLSCVVIACSRTQSWWAHCATDPYFTMIKQ